MINTIKELYLYIASDMYRYMTCTSFKSFCRAWFIAGFRYTFFLRCCKYFRQRWYFLPAFFICRLMHRHYTFKYGIQIPYQTEIGPGLAIGHFGGIIVNPHSKIGKNCNLAPNMLLGLSFNKETNQFEYPTIGDCVAFANSAKVIGGVTIGNRAFIGINTLVTKDVPENAVVVGSPAKIISDEGSYQYCGSFHPWTR